MSGFVRFVHGEQIEGVGFRAGFLDAAYCLRNEPLIAEKLHAQLTKYIEWYKANLEIPNKFNRSKSKGAWRKNSKGLSWFKPEASEHIVKAHELCELLNRSGVATDVLHTDRVGYILYQDDFQVVAEPFADTPT